MSWANSSLVVDRKNEPQGKFRITPINELVEKRLKELSNRQNQLNLLLKDISPAHERKRLADLFFGEKKVPPEAVASFDHAEQLRKQELALIRSQNKLLSDAIKNPPKDILSRAEYYRYLLEQYDKKFSSEINQVKTAQIGCLEELSKIPSNPPGSLPLIMQGVELTKEVLKAGVSFVPGTDPFIFGLDLIEASFNQVTKKREADWVGVGISAASILAPFAAQKYAHRFSKVARTWHAFQVSLKQFVEWENIAAKLEKGLQRSLSFGDDLFKKLFGEISFPGTPALAGFPSTHKIPNDIPDMTRMYMRGHDFSGQEYINELFIEFNRTNKIKPILEVFGNMRQALGASLSAERYAEFQNKIISLVMSHAQAHPGDIIENASHLPIDSPEARRQILHICFGRHPDEAIAKLADFGLPKDQLERFIIDETVRRGPEITLKFPADILNAVSNRGILVHIIETMSNSSDRSKFLSLLSQMKFSDNEAFAFIESFCKKDSELAMDVLTSFPDMIFSHENRIRLREIFRKHDTGKKYVNHRNFHLIRSDQGQAVS